MTPTPSQKQVLTVTVRVICDSSCNVPEPYQESLGIVQVPAWVNFADGTSLRNGVDISDAEFYRRLETEKELPTTSQPTPQDFVQAIEAHEADEYVVAAVSSKLSGTYNSAVQAAALLPERKIHLHDTLNASMGSAWQIIAGAELASQGADAEAVLAKMAEVREAVETIFIIDTLKYLAASGRAPVIQAVVGNLLSIKPMLQFEDGVLELTGRFRGRKRSKQELVNRMAALMGDRPVRLAVCHANARDEAAGLREVVEARMNVQELQIVEVGPVLGALAGPGTLALAAYPTA
ncbi:MAG: DegV family protein [Chloroflexi bacterium]|nr:MAG: DegV family protein [Chloroflexota bacterium]